MKEKNRDRKAWKRTRSLSGHHIVNKCRGGESTKSNILRLDSRRHEAFHLLFGNMDFDEVIELLIRTKELKGC